MRYGIFSDLHANLEATSVVFEELSKRKIENFICLGDIVGYGPNPNECITLIKELNKVYIVAGNHDAGVCGLKDITWFNEYAQKAILWTAKVMTQKNIDYLSNLAKVIVIDNFTIVHGSPRDPLDEYLLTLRQLFENLYYFTTNICFIGHSHIPFIYTKNENSLFLTYDKPISLSNADRYIINVGSVGQPRDSDPRACYAIYDSDKLEIQFFRTEYAILQTQEKMFRANLPEFLIQRLSRGE